jgi:AraC-like DNA-binding protein
MHTHEGVEVYYFIKGKANFIINDDVYDLSPGDMLLFRGSVIHRINPQKEVPYIRSYANFSEKFLANDIPEDVFPKLWGLFDSPKGLLIHWEPEEREGVENMYRTLCEEEDKESFGHDLFQKAILLQLLIKVYRKTKQLPTAAVSVQQPSPIQANVRRILQFINQHYTSDVSLNEFSKALHLNKYYLCHIFKEVTGYSINNYMVRKRVEEAKKLLETTDEPIGAIAERLGFNTPIHFSRSFKQLTGVPPQAYRKIALKK